MILNETYIYIYICIRIVLKRIHILLIDSLWSQVKKSLDTQKQA